MVKYCEKKQKRRREVAFMKTYILLNPLAGHDMNGYRAHKLCERLGVPPEDCKDVTKINYMKFFETLAPQDSVIICGGDGTLARFAMFAKSNSIKNDVFYCATGEVNDFIRDLDLAEQDDLVKVNHYVKNLPIATVNGKEYALLNGIGMGVDASARARELEMRSRNLKNAKHGSIVAGLLLFRMKPRVATVTIDGVTGTFKNVWCAQTLIGRYSAGLMSAPKQKRVGDGKLTLFLMRGIGRFKALMVYNLAQRGEHVKHKDMCKLLRGKDITVTFDKPTSIQINGEIIENVTEYRVRV